MHIFEESAVLGYVGYLMYRDCCEKSKREQEREMYIVHCFSWRTESNWVFRFYWKDHHTLSIFCRLLRWSAKCYFFFLQNISIYAYVHVSVSVAIKFTSKWPNLWVGASDSRVRFFVGCFCCYCCCCRSCSSASSSFFLHFFFFVFFYNICMYLHRCMLLFLPYLLYDDVNQIMRNVIMQFCRKSIVHFSLVWAKYVFRMYYCMSNIKKCNKMFVCDWEIVKLWELLIFVIETKATGRKNKI